MATVSLDNARAPVRPHDYHHFMLKPAQAVRAARDALKLDRGRMARLVGMAAERFTALEEGALPKPEELDAVAITLGLTVEQLVAGESTRSPLRYMLFRATEQQRMEAVDAWADTGAQRSLGEFIRCTHHLQEVLTLLGETPRASFAQAPQDLRQPQGSAPYGSQILAGWLRGRLSLGATEPIPSMLELVTAMGITVFWVTPEELDPTVDGASTLTPLPAILVNLVEGPACWWRTRMTLAHELCHLIADYGRKGRPNALVSPVALQRVQRYSFFEGFDLLERRANAFAGNLLAPEAAVRSVVGTLDATSDKAIGSVGSTLGLGRVAAINRLTHIFRLSDSTRLDMMARQGKHWSTHPGSFADAPERVPTLRATIEDATMRALATGKIDQVRARQLLRVPMTEASPDHAAVSEADRAPLRSVEDTIRAIAQEHLQHRLGRRDVVAGRVQPTDEGWRVDVVSSQDARTDHGHVQVSYDRAVLSTDLVDTPGG